MPTPGSHNLACSRPCRCAHRLDAVGRRPIGLKNKSDSDQCCASCCSALNGVCGWAFEGACELASSAIGVTFRLWRAWSQWSRLLTNTSGRCNVLLRAMLTRDSCTPHARAGACSNQQGSMRMRACLFSHLRSRYCIDTHTAVTDKSAVRR